jgi:hypothetical protein
MTTSTEARRELPKGGIDLACIAQGAAAPGAVARGSGLPAPRPAAPPLGPEEAAPAWAEPEEVLVADARHGLTPAQMVDQKLLALLGGGHPGLPLQAPGRPGNVRRGPAG